MRSIKYRYFKGVLVVHFYVYIVLNYGKRISNIVYSIVISKILRSKDITLPMHAT